MKYVLCMMMLCFSLTAEVKLDKDKFGTVRSIVYTGYVLDGKHAQRIAARYVGKRPWVGNGKLYRSGNMFLIIIGTDSVVVTVSHEMAMSHNKYATKLRTIRRKRATVSTPPKRSRSRSA